MYCTKCGTQMATSAHFCPGCGVAVTADTTAGVPPSRSRRSTSLLIAGVLVVIAAVVVTVILRRAPSPVAGVTLPPVATLQGAAPDTPTATAGVPAMPTTPAFDWSGLSHEDLVKARNSLDAAIAHEEHSSSDGTAAQAAAR